MMCDAFLELFDRGKISNRYKYTDRNKMVYTFSMGSKELYDSWTTTLVRILPG